VGSTLVFTAGGESVVSEAGDRRDARRRSTEDPPEAVPTGGGRPN
jgi:hypothetical protein